MNKESECACTHPDALTCLAEHLHTTRFNALLLRGHGDIDAGLGGYCTCPCHRGAQYRTDVRSAGRKKKARTT